MVGRQLKERRIQISADVILRAIVEEKDAYNNLRSCQSEGRFNDSGISMRDMYAVRRGTGYKGEDVSEKRNKFLNNIDAAFRKKLELEKKASQQCQTAKGLEKATEYFVRLNRTAREYSYDFFKGEFRWQKVTKHGNI